MVEPEIHVRESFVIKINPIRTKEVNECNERKTIEFFEIECVKIVSTVNPENLKKFLLRF